jgi:hypothetical protein
LALGVGGCRGRGSGYHGDGVVFEIILEGPLLSFWACWVREFFLWWQWRPMWLLMTTSVTTKWLHVTTVVTWSDYMWRHDDDWCDYMWQPSSLGVTTCDDMMTTHVTTCDNRSHLEWLHVTTWWRLMWRPSDYSNSWRRMNKIESWVSCGFTSEMCPIIEISCPIFLRKTKCVQFHRFHIGSVCWNSPWWILTYISST